MRRAFWVKVISVSELVNMAAKACGKSITRAHSSVE